MCLERVSVDFGKIMGVLGAYGIVCTNDDFNPQWPLVHFTDGYTCNLSPHDVKVIREIEIVRIDGPSRFCPYHKKRRG